MPLTIPLSNLAMYTLASFPSGRHQELVYHQQVGKCNLFLLLQLHTSRLPLVFQPLERGRQNKHITNAAQGWQIKKKKAI